MDKKILVILVIFIACMSALTLGCTGKSPSPSQSPAATLSVSATPPTPTPGVSDNSITPSPAANNPTDNISGIDESLLNISGEQDESLPEDNIATPDAGQ